jgi:hypothetical protein
MRTIGILIVLWAAGGAVATEPFRKKLTSVSDNLATAEWEVQGKNVTPDCPSNWWVLKGQLHGGKQEGVELIIIDNGKLRINLSPTRGMGVLDVSQGDLRLGWDSPVKETVHPKYINLQGRGGLGWLEGFNEFVCRCGLESNGHPGTDTFINNVGEEAKMELTLHGKAANLPASEVEVVVDRDPPYRIHIRGRVDERSFYGPKLELQTEFSTEPGSSSFRIADVITNRGSNEQEYEVLYHANYGRPLLEEGSAFVGPIERVTPFNDHAAKSVANYTTYGGPDPHWVEQVYCLRPFADAQGKTLIMLANKNRDKAVSMGFALKELPYLTLWKNTAAEEDGYVTGLEPGTNFPYNRRLERKAGRVPKLAPGASRTMTIDFSILVGKDEVQETRERVAAIQGDRKTTVDTKPEKIE